MPETKKYENQFFDALRDIFVGAKIEGDSGYINLMRIKSRYYEQGVFPQLKKDINEALEPFPDFREELFDKLYTFFQRYFSESGSIYFRYTSLHQNVYEKVYTDDRDVMLFWKTHMLYYVKTDRIFVSLNVEVDDFKFFFDASNITLKKSNEKREVIYSFRSLSEDGTLVFDVAYSERGRNTKVDDILRDLRRAGQQVTDETLSRAFRVFEKQSEVDYFINKNARAFLQEQFDLWLYQYLFAGQNVWSAERLAQLQALKSIALKIIDFISQFEDELVKIWNKPKFVRNSHYIITLDHIMNYDLLRGEIGTTKQSNELSLREGDFPTKQSNELSLREGDFPTKQSNELSLREGDFPTKQSNELSLREGDFPTKQSPTLWNRILAHPNMPAQVQEWHDLGVVDADFKLEMLSETDLTGAPVYPYYQFLSLDTKHFPDLELDILSLFEDLDASLDGWLIHSENYQALNSLANKFREKIKVTYIDPPYNTSASEIMYENQYKHSSWNTLINDRLVKNYDLLTEDAIFCVSIDYFEFPSLSFMLDAIFKEENHLSTIAVRSNPHGRAMASGFSQNHEYALFYKKSNKSIVGRLARTELRLARYPERDEIGAYAWMNMRKTGLGSTKDDRPKLYYPIYVSSKGKIRIPSMSWNESLGGWIPNSPPMTDEEIVLPIDESGKERVWNLGWERAQNEITKNISAKQVNKQWQIHRKYRPNEEGALPNTWWDDSKYSATESGTKRIKDLFGDRELFTFPKSIYLVEDSLKASNADKESIILDYFAGSATSAHAVMNLNRADNGNRKYLMIEMGEHFNSVIVPRIKKVAFSDVWKEGRPNGGQGMSQFVKYYEFEQYEETLGIVHYGDADLFNNPYEDPYHSYIFLRDEKLLAALEVDTANNTVHVHPERIYPDIDLAETISQRRGKWIKRITKEYVEFQDGEKQSLVAPDWQVMKPLIWW